MWKWYTTDSHYWGVNIGSGNGLVQSGNNSLHDPVLTQIYDAIRRHNPQLVKLHPLDNAKKLQLCAKTTNRDKRIVKARF